MRKRLLQLFAVGLVVFMVFMTGCGASKSKSESSAAAPAVRDSGVLYDKNGSSEAANNSDAVKVAYSSATGTSLNQTVQSININKKIIKNASASLEVANADQAIETISKWLDDGTGYEFSKSSVMRGQYKQINVLFKVKPEKLSEFLIYLNSIGKVTNSNSTSNDITDQYYDTSARLDNLRKGREQLLEIMKKAVTIDETLRVQSELNKITGEIEVQQGRLDMWNKLVDESSVNLTIVEEADPMKVNRDISWRFSSFGDILKFMKNGFILTSNTIINAFVWVVVAAVSASPVIVLGVVAFVFFRKRKNSKKG